MAADIVAPKAKARTSRKPGPTPMPDSKPGWKRLHEDLQTAIGHATCPDAPGWQRLVKELEAPNPIIQHTQAETIAVCQSVIEWFTDMGEHSEVLCLVVGALEEVRNEMEKDRTLTDSRVSDMQRELASALKQSKATIAEQVAALTQTHAKIGEQRKRIETLVERTPDILEIVRNENLILSLRQKLRLALDKARSAEKRAAHAEALLQNKAAIGNQSRNLDRIGGREETNVAPPQHSVDDDPLGQALRKVRERNDWRQTVDWSTVPLGQFYPAISALAIRASAP